MNDLKKYMLQMSSMIEDEYNRIQGRVKEDPGTAGDNGEENWADFFRKWLPNTYHVVTKGRIMNIKGVCSPQIDILILSPNYPPFLLQKKEYLAGGVIAAFECKLTLRLEHIYEAVNTAKIISNLCTLTMANNKKTPFSLLHGDIVYGLLSHSHPWEKLDKTYDKIDKAISRGAKKAQIKSPKELIDLICIVDLCTWGSDRIINFKDNLENSLILTSMMAYKGKYWGHDEFENQADFFSPLGVLLSRLIRRMAWKDYSLRDIASYFQEVQMEGTGEGSIDGYKKMQRLTEIYNTSILEKHKQHSIERDNLFILWDEWGEHFF